MLENQKIKNNIEFKTFTILIAVYEEKHKSKILQMADSNT